ncbi:alpha-E domain-containing protein [Ferrovibrio sp.]|uniref:alpha-E domain-containing protein n=2 Tax=Ferrovibrio sp. TaxID=1917215 RepID=UPI0035164765
MLSRAADNLYWMMRYTERAENMARILDVAHRMALQGNVGQERGGPWGPALIIAGCEQAFALHGGPSSPRNVIDFLAFNPDNPSSILACLKAARENARAMRAQITSEAWQSINAAWLEMRGLSHTSVESDGYSIFFDWVRERSHLFRGVAEGTMPRGDAYNFMRLGTLLERADSTARILDVKYHILLPSVAEVGGAVDYYQWAALLRSVSSFRIYRQIYRDVIKPTRVAELLVLRADMPRSLHACFAEIVEIMQELREGYRRNYLSVRMAESMLMKLRYGNIDDIFARGLHEYLTEMVDANIELGAQLARDFMQVA